MLILKAPAQAETWAKNSRFLTEAFYVETPEEAREVWRSRRLVHDNGGHIVCAFITGPQGNVAGCSDDGEPSGTAGRPMLAVLKGSGITNILITAARWFGGTKLGTGGLVQAYTNCAQSVLERAVTAELVELADFELALPYALYERCRLVLAGCGAEVLHDSFDALVHVEGRLPAAEKENLSRALSELGGGRIAVQFRPPLTGN